MDFLFKKKKNFIIYFEIRVNTQYSIDNYLGLLVKRKIKFVHTRINICVSFTYERRKTNFSLTI